ncbi:MAG: DUF882 domain-containing protein [Labilithrix sp.]|nr:DUF882 domain-containing protein [Labilithrix sp.]
MKPVVSSLVALAIAMAPLGVMAKPAHSGKTSHAKVVKHKAAKGTKSIKAAKADKIDKAPIVRVKAGKKDGAGIKPLALKKVVHHAHDVDLAGAGHREPKVESGVLVAASMKTPASHGKAPAKASPAKGSSVASDVEDMPRLPSPNAAKPSKGGSEKGAARKAAPKKAEPGDDGERARDEEIADLVARIRGRRTASPDDQEARAADARDAKAAKSTPHAAKPPPCTKEPVEIVRGPEIERFSLTNCDGTPAPLAAERLSILIRPGGAARPTAPLAELAKKPGAELAHGVRRVDPRLVGRIQAVVDHFGKPGSPAKLAVISGYRPASVGSMHASGRAIDFRVEGARNEDVVAFCKTLVDTGCGFYPNSSFVHIDVRDPGAGHVSWIDASGPGETPRYVPVWPPPPPPTSTERHLHRASATTERSSERSLEDLAEEGASLLRARRPNEGPGRWNDGDADAAEDAESER